MLNSVEIFSILNTKQNKQINGNVLKVDFLQTYLPEAYYILNTLMHYASNICTLINIHDALLHTDKDVDTAWET